MAVQYSDHYNVTQPAITITSPAIKTRIGVNNRTYKRATATLTLTDFGIGDVCRMFTVKRGDTLRAMYLSSTGASTATLLDVGLHESGLAHDGAVRDADEFGSAVDVNAGINRTEILVEAGATVVGRRGMQVWEIAGYATEDVAPAEFDVTVTATAAVATASEVIVLEAEGYFG